VPGLQPVPGVTVYALAAYPTLSCALPPGATSNEFTCAPLTGNIANSTTYIGPGQPLANGPVLASAVTDDTGRYALVIPQSVLQVAEVAEGCSSITASTTVTTATGSVSLCSSGPLPIDIAIQVPSGYNGCAGNAAQLYPSAITGTQTVSVFSSASSLQSNLTLAPGPGVAVTRCTTTLGTVVGSGSSPVVPAGIAGPSGWQAVPGTGPIPGTWNDGGSFAMVSQNLTAVPGGESSTRRLEAVVPFYANTPDTSRLGGWDLETQEIRVVNTGQTRTVAELDFFATDANGNVSTAATQTADLIPGQGASLRPATPGIGSQIPGGSLGWVGVFSTIPTGQIPGGLYSLSSLAATYTTSVTNAGGARTVTNAVPREEIVSPTAGVGQGIAYRNYGGTAAKWSTILVVTNLGPGTTVQFQLQQKLALTGPARPACYANCNISRVVNSAGEAMLNLGDNTDPDVAQLGDQAEYAVAAYITGGPLTGVLFSDQYPNVIQAGFLVTSINVSVVGKQMTILNGVPMPTVVGSSSAITGVGQYAVVSPALNAAAYYLPLVFKNYNCSATDLAATQSNGTPCGWNSGISVETGLQGQFFSASVSWSVNFYDRSGAFIGSLSNNLSTSTYQRSFYLPEITWLPDGFSGEAVIQVFAGGSGAVPFTQSGTVDAQTVAVNYGRNQALAYNAISSSTAVNRTDRQGSLPCTSVGYTDCLWVAKFDKHANDTNPNYQLGTPTAPLIPTGENVGVRIYNPDIPTLTSVEDLPGEYPGEVVPAPTVAGGNAAYINVAYFDDAGFPYGGEQEEITVPSGGTATLFPLDNNVLPNIFSGTEYISATGNYIVAVANDVDYSVVGFDASGAFLPQYSNGYTQ
jgi:hypothetical protein